MSPYKIAVLLTALGQADAALARLDEARRVRDDRLVLIGVDRLLDPLRSDARFRAIQQEVMSGVQAVR